MREFQLLVGQFRGNLRNAPADFQGLLFAFGGDHVPCDGLGREETGSEHVDFEVGLPPFLEVERPYGEVNNELIGRDVALVGGGFNALLLIGIDPNLLGKRRGHGVVCRLFCGFSHELPHELVPVSAHSSKNSPGNRPRRGENRAAGAARKMNALNMGRRPGSNQFATSKIEGMRCYLECPSEISHLRRATQKATHYSRHDRAVILSDLSRLKAVTGHARARMARTAAGCVGCEIQPPTGATAG